MKDFLGNNLEVGDEVVFMCLGYRELRKGIISKMTDKTIFIECGRLKPFKQTPSQIIKINSWKN